MTRGQIAIVTPEGKIMTSMEFNGDMYFDGHGKEVFDELDLVENVKDYTDFVEQFNRNHFHYTDRDMFFDCDDNYFDMKSDYFGKWFSDYVYIKNLSEKPAIFTDSGGKKIQLDCDTTAVFYFGECIAASKEDFEAATFIEQLKYKKDNLSCDVESNYADIWNMCADYDNNHRGIYLTDRIMEHDFVDEDILEYIVKEQSQGGIDRLRCFIGDTYSADLYRRDGYGNLANVDNSDFEDLIDDLVYELEQNISIPYAQQEICL